MEVILAQDFPALGFTGERVNVKKGYARNFLVPRGIAVESSSKKAKSLKHNLDVINAKRRKQKKAAEELAEQLNQVILEFTLKAGEKGKFFGSISTNNIIEALAAQGIAVDKKQVTLGETVKQPGEYKATLKIHAEVSAKVTIKVEANEIHAKPKKRSKSKKRTEKEAAADGEPEEAEPVAKKEFQGAEEDVQATSEE